MVALIIILFLCLTQSLTMLSKISIQTSVWNTCYVQGFPYFDLLVALDASKSTGHDKIAAKMLKCTAECIILSLTKLFNLSISTGVFPSEWKTGRIVPIPKGNNQLLPSGFQFFGTAHQERHRKTSTGECSHITTVVGLHDFVFYGFCSI